MKPAPIFLYGTLLQANALAKHSKDKKLPNTATPAILLGYRRTTLRGTPYPTLSPHPRGAIAGELIRPTPNALTNLKHYEGPAYRLHPIRVLTPRGPRHARAWIAALYRASTTPWP